MAQKLSSNRHRKAAVEVSRKIESLRTVQKLLNRDIHKNQTLIWFVLALIATYEECLSIGSFGCATRTRRALIRAWRRIQAGLCIYLQNAHRIVSYKGYFDQTNSKKVAIALRLKAVFKAARKKNKPRGKER